MLGVLGARRHPEFPNVPIFAEQGFPIDLRVWGGFMAPVGTPQDIIDTLAKAVNELNVHGAPYIPMAAYQFAETIRRQILRHRQKIPSNLLKLWRPRRDSNPRPQD